MIGAGEGLVEDPEMAPESARAVNEKRRVDSPREVGERHVLGVELIVAIFEVVHCDVAPVMPAAAVERSFVSIIAQPGE